MKSLQSCPTLCDPIDSSPWGSPSLGFSRQEHWSGLPFPSPMCESEKWKWSCSVVSDSVWPHRRAAHLAPLSLGFSRQEYWSGLPFVLQCRKVKSESEVNQSCLTLSDPMDYSLPGSSVHGIFQARVLEWGAIAFSEYRYRYSQKFAFFFLTEMPLCPNTASIHSYGQWYSEFLKRL